MPLMSRMSSRVGIGAVLSAASVFVAWSESAYSESCGSRALVGLQEQAGAAFSTRAPALSVSVKQAEVSPVTWKSPSTDLIRSEQEQPLFHVGSITKTFTAALILLLDQERKLRIADPIDGWIDLPSSQGITVEMLLTHTSGIPDILDLPGHAAQDSPEDSLAHIVKADPLFLPGTRWKYSNSNYLLLGLIVERVTGQSYADVLSEKILQPLELNDTYLWGTEDRQGVLPGFRLACGSIGQASCDVGKTYPLERISNGRDWRVAWSAGGLVSTARDLSIWIQALVKGTLLDDAHRKLLLTPTPLSIAGLNKMGQFNGISWHAMSMGLMQFKLDNGSQVWGHSGYIDGFSAIAAAGEGLPSMAITVSLEQSNVYELLASGFSKQMCFSAP